MNKLKEFLDNNGASKVLVCIDWANVFNWKRIKREGRIIKTEEVIIPQKLYGYLDKEPRITDKKIFFGLEKARETIMDNIVRWVNIKKSKQVKNLDELISDLEDIESKEKITSVDLKRQIGAIYNEYRSNKRIEEFKAIGFDVISKDVKIFRTSLTDLSKFKYIIKDLQKDIEAIKQNLSRNLKLPGIIGEDNVDELKLQIEKITKVCSKKIKNRKCDFDVDIVVNIIRNIENFDTFVIFSGDGDYASAVEYFLEKGKNIAMISLEKELGREFNKIPSSVNFHKIFADNINDIWDKNTPEDHI